MPSPGFRRRLHLSIGRRGVERGIDEELRFHIDMRAEELMRAGASREEAMERARREFGDVTEARRELAVIDNRARATASRAEWWEGGMQDIRVALRSFARQPGFAVVVLLTLALGVGANTAMFSVVNAVLLRPLPYAAPERLVHIWETHQGDVSNRSEASYPDFLDWREQTEVFDALEGYDETNVTISDANGAEMVRGARVTSGFFRMLRVSPEFGRTFETNDDAPGSAAVVLSHAFWARRFGSAADVVGKSMTIDGVPHEIRGVLPGQFSFAAVGDADVWLPIGRGADVRTQRFNHWLQSVGRLRPGVSVDLARQRLAAVMRRLAAEYPESNSGRGIIVTPLREVFSSGLTRPLVVLSAAVGILLLIACANIASLVLARAVEREHEIAVRSAIGASRLRLVQQLLTENLLLAVAGGVLGVWLATRGVHLLVLVAPTALVDRMPALRDTSADMTTLVFTLAVVVVTGLLFGLGPSLLATRRPSAELLRGDTRSGAGPRRPRLRETLVVAEIALTLVLLVGATLMGRSVLALLRVDPGFRSEGVATVRAALAGPRYVEGARQTGFFEEVLARVRALPGVDAAGAISSPPLQGGGTNTFHVDGRPQPDPASRPEATTRAVAGDYFRALRIPVVQGRALNEHDDLKSPYAVVVSESLARHLFGGQRAIGERLRFYAWQDSAWTIVGIAGDVKTDALDEPAQPTIYYSHLQGPANRMTIVARSSRIPPTTVVNQMRRSVSAIDPGVAIYSAGTMTDHIHASQAVYSRRYVLILLGVFAGVALTLASVGLYGVIAYLVTQRKREIAIRMALGAQTSSVLALVLGRGVRLFVAGSVIGALAAAALARALQSMLFAVGTRDGWTYAIVLLVLSCVALVASYVPARHASHLDPALALRGQ